MKIDFDASDHIVTVTKSGAASVSDIIGFIDKGVALGLKHDCHDLIFDMQEAIETGSFNELYEFHKNLIQLTKLTNNHRCAVVFSPNENKSERQFYETVAANWGQGIFKIFFQLKEGLEWLKLSKNKI